MRFSIAIFATIALSVFASATPVVVRDASVQGGVQTILTNLQKAVTLPAAQLASIQSNNATESVVKPLITELTTAISTATNQVKGLKGPQGVPLATITKLVVNILTLLISTLAGLAKILGPGGDLTALLPPVGAALGLLVAALLTAVAGLVAQLIPALTGLLASVSGLVTTLGLGSLVTALGL